MPNPEIQEFITDLLDKHARGACTPQEAQFLMKWYENIGNGDDAPLHGEARELIRQRLWAKINPEPQKAKLLPWLYKIAAILLLPIVAGIGFYLSRDTPTPLAESSQDKVVTLEPSLSRIFNEGNKARKVTLADGSVVVLQPKTEIQYASEFTGALREVHLKGEAFFDVSPDPHHPFMVYANEVVTRVLGTSFNIRAYEKDQEITVVVKTGKVSVYTNRDKSSEENNSVDSQEVILTPNQKMVYDRHKEIVSKQLVEEPKILLPQSNLFAMQFENAAVSKIFEVLERNYGVEIHYDKKILSNCRLTTSMSEEGLYERIEVICKAIGASYFISDAIITIKSKGC